MQKVSQEHLDTLEEFLRERSHNAPFRNQKPKVPEAEQLQIEFRPPSPKREPEVMEEVLEDKVEVEPQQEYVEPEPEIVQKQPGEKQKLNIMFIILSMFIIWFLFSSQIMSALYTLSRNPCNEFIIHWLLHVCKSICHYLHKKLPTISMMPCFWQLL